MTATPKIFINSKFLCASKIVKITTFLVCQKFKATHRYIQYYWSHKRKSSTYTRYVYE